MKYIIALFYVQYTSAFDGFCSVSKRFQMHPPVSVCNVKDSWLIVREGHCFSFFYGLVYEKGNVYFAFQGNICKNDLGVFVLLKSADSVRHNRRVRARNF